MKNLKKVRVVGLFLATILLGACGRNDGKKENTEAGKGSATVTLTAKGSDTVIPLEQQEAEK